MNPETLSLRHLVRSEATARLVSFNVIGSLGGAGGGSSGNVSPASSADYETSDGFRFRVPFRDMLGTTFPSEGKAIVFMKWIKASVAAIQAADLEEEAEALEKAPVVEVLTVDDVARGKA